MSVVRPAPGNPASTTDPKGSTVETSGSDTSVKDGVPEGMNFNGTNIVTSYREDKVDYFVGDVDGDVMSEALYKANLAVEERPWHYKGIHPAAGRGAYEQNRGINSVG